MAIESFSPPFLKADLKLGAELRERTRVLLSKAKRASTATNSGVNVALEWFEMDLVGGRRFGVRRLERDRLVSAFFRWDPRKRLLGRAFEQTWLSLTTERISSQGSATGGPLDDVACSAAFTPESDAYAHCRFENVFRQVLSHNFTLPHL